MQQHYAHDMYKRFILTYSTTTLHAATTSVLSKHTIQQHYTQQQQALYITIAATTTDVLTKHTTQHETTAIILSKHTTLHNATTKRII